MKSTLVATPQGLEKRQLIFILIKYINMSSPWKEHLKHGSQQTNMKGRTFNLTPLTLSHACGYPEDKQYSGSWDWKFQASSFSAEDINGISDLEMCWCIFLFLLFCLLTLQPVCCYKKVNGLHLLQILEAKSTGHL